MNNTNIMNFKYFFLKRKFEPRQMFAGDMPYYLRKMVYYSSLIFDHTKFKSSLIFDQRVNILSPIEVQSVTGTTLKSMHAFLVAYLQSPYEIKISLNNFSHYEKDTFLSALCSGCFF